MNRATEFDVLSLGVLVADLVARPVRALPGKGELVAVDEMKLHTGGGAVNTGIGLARLGLRTAIMGKVGQDTLGDIVLAQLGREGLDTHGVVIDPVAGTSATMVMVAPDGERSFIHYTGANAEFTEADVDFDLVARARLLHIGYIFVMPKFDGEPMARVLKRAKQMGLKTSLDTSWDPGARWLELIEPCLPYVDYLAPSLVEARLIAGWDEPEEIADFFLSYGVKVVALKMGERGSYVASDHEAFYTPAFDVEVVDATGAGDAFVAGFLYGLTRGWDLRQTARLANACGARAVTAVGATAGARGLEENLKFMENTRLKEI